MNMQGIVALLPAVPTAVLAAESVANGDVMASVTQLGIGGVLVAFAVWLQDRFARQNRADLQIEREAHDVTRQQLIDLLKRQLEDKK